MSRHGGRPVKRGRRRQIQGELGEKKALRLLWQRLTLIRVPLIVGIVLTLVGAAFNLGYGKIAKDFLDMLIHGKGNLTVGSLNFYIAVFLAISLTRSFIGIATSYAWGYAAQKLTRRLREELFTAIQSKSLAFFDQRKTGQLMSVLNADVSGCGSLLDAIQDSISAPFILVGGTILLYWLNWKLALVTTVCLPLAALIILWATRKIRGFTAQIQAGRAAILDVAQESFAAIRIVKSFANEEFEIRRFRNQSHNLFRLLLRTMRIRLVMRPAVDLIGTAAVLIVVWVACSQILRGGDGSLTFGDLAWFVLVLQRVADAAQEAGKISLLTTTAGVSADRVFTVLMTPNDVEEKPDAVELPPDSNRVEFENVRFAYSAGIPVLDDISFTMEPGEVVALVGPTGAGKTTIAALIPRFYEVSGGAVRVGGMDIRDVTLKSLRQQIGIVPQDTILFAGTLRENIAYGRLDATEEEIIAAAKTANAWEFIEKLPKGLDTRVSERGVSLSGGQRQRMAIARAVLRNPRILILDEATSSLDARSEALVQDALQKLVRERTTLVIAHRLSTIRNADKILVLKEGRIIECGHHEELLALGGVYADLYRTQFREQERRELSGNGVEPMEVIPPAGVLVSP